MSLPSKTAELDPALGVFGFEIDVVSAAEVTGRLRITDRCCQPFKVLHGGVSALISEGMASMGAHVSSGFRRIAGIHLSVNHLRSATVGDLVFARAVPVHAGKTIQVWEVLLWKMNQSNMEKEALITSSKVTIIANLPIPPNAKNADIALKRKSNSEKGFSCSDQLDMGSLGVIAAVLLLSCLLLPAARSFYLPGVAPRDFQRVIS